MGHRSCGGTCVESPRPAEHLTTGKLRGAFAIAIAVTCLVTAILFAARGVDERCRAHVDECLAGPNVQRNGTRNSRGNNMHEFVIGRHDGFSSLELIPNGLPGARRGSRRQDGMGAAEAPFRLPNGTASMESCSRQHETLRAAWRCPDRAAVPPPLTALAERGILIAYLIAARPGVGTEGPVTGIPHVNR